MNMYEVCKLSNETQSSVISGNTWDMKLGGTAVEHIMSSVQV